MATVEEGHLSQKTQNNVKKIRTMLRSLLSRWASDFYWCILIVLEFLLNWVS